MVHEAVQETHTCSLVLKTFIVLKVCPEQLANGLTAIASLGVGRSGIKDSVHGGDNLARWVWQIYIFSTLLKEMLTVVSTSVEMTGENF
jgi:hypothetical protein